MNLISPADWSGWGRGQHRHASRRIKVLSSIFHPGTNKGGHYISNAKATTPFTRAVSHPLYQLGMKQVRNDRGLSRGTEEKRRTKTSEKLAALSPWLCHAGLGCILPFPCRYSASFLAFPFLPRLAGTVFPGLERK